MIYTCHYVKASDLFAGNIDLWDEFSNSDPDCSWGDNNRTMVVIETILKTFKTKIDADPIKMRWKQICEDADATCSPRPQYVDLEN